jgi:hypothetical protein
MTTRSVSAAFTGPITMRLRIKAGKRKLRGWPDRIISAAF